MPTTIVPSSIEVINTGKYLDTVQVEQTVSGGTLAVQREVVVLADPSTVSGYAEVTRDSPTSGSYGLVARSIIYGTQEDGSIAQVPVTQNGYLTATLPAATSPFNEIRSASRTAVIELNSTYGVSALRNITSVAGTGAVAAASSGEIEVKTGATASSTALLQSSEYGRYMPGYSAEVGIGLRIPTAPTGAQKVRWGLFTSTEGIYFGRDATGFYVARLRNSVETVVRQADWNIDKLDGTGASGVTLDGSAGNIFQIEFTWYGYGAITFKVVATVDNVQQVIPAHAMQVTGSTSLQDPNIPIAVAVENGATASDFAVYAGGRQYSIIGNYEPIYRFTGAARASVNTSTTAIPTVTFRRKSGFLNRSVKIAGISVIAATQPVVVELRVNGSLTGASYTTPTNCTASETALEMDISATAISGGQVIWSDLVPAGNNPATPNFGSRDELDIDIPETQPVSLCVYTLTGTGAAVTLLRMREEW